MTDRVDINRLLMDMRQMKAQTQAFHKPQGLAAKDVQAIAQIPGLKNSQAVSEVPTFSELMSQAINKVNETQKASSAMKNAYTLGDPDVGITDVMVASQKSTVAFQATVQVRNKVIEAYRDIMNMPM